MKLHLPVRLFKSVLACLTAVASFSLGSGVAWAEAQNLTFSGSSLTWDTSAENKPFVDEEDAAASFAAGDNVSFTGESTVTLGENITAGTLDIAAGADVTIDLGNYTLHTDTISLSGTLAVGNSLSIASGSTLAVKNAAAVLDSALVLGEKSGLVVESAASLNSHTLTLQGGSNLILTAAGDGKTYTLFSGVTSLVDKNGNTLTAGSYSINDYFDKSAPGSGFWADATLVLTVDGTLQLVRHNETVKEAVAITTRRTSGADYQYYAGVSFKNIEYAAVDSNADGGAIYGQGTITLSNNGSVKFIGNTASSADSYCYGGAIYGHDYSTIALSDNGSVEFSGNSASSGGAIYGWGGITLSDNGSVEFSGNKASGGYARGGAIYGDVDITLSNNGSVEFSGNTASSYGGAIYGASNSTITLSNNGSVAFSGNSASSYGGVIYGVSNSTITLSNNGSVEFSGNSAYDGGAIYGDSNSTITLSDNGSVEFSGNSASSYGGAIYGYSRTISLNNNGSVTFSGNTASTSSYYAYGGAICGYGKSKISLSNNGRVTFSENSAFGDNEAYGGAIYGRGDIVLSNNGGVEFSGNSVSGDMEAYGGAIYGASTSTITLSNNGSVAFSGNSAFGDNEAYGGAIYGSVTLSNNDSVVFCGNSASSSGGAIYGDSNSTITMTGNDSVTFSGNTASSSGGAIYTSGSLHIRNNDSVEFAGNVEKNGSIYRLRSVYVYGGSDDVLNISAAAGKSVTFYDSIYVGSDATVNLNADYEDAEGNIIEQKGDIVFSGATTVEDLYKAKGNVAGTAAEIRLSRTTEVNTLTNLYGGRLRVEDGAIYQGCGITTHEGSEATVLVKDAILEHRGYNMTYNTGTLLELAGESFLGSDSLNMMQGSHVVLDATEPTFLALLSGNLLMNGSMEVRLDANNESSDENRLLMYVAGDISGWKENTLSVTGRETVGSDDLTWVDNWLVLNYNENTYKTSICFFNRQTEKLEYEEYKNIYFCQSSNGGAIYGASNSAITLSNNGSVEFSGNSSSSSGGAIYGESNSTITLSSNGSVAFSGNSASGGYARGGAIYGVSHSTITLSDNGSVEFSGNSASSSGGAIYGLWGDITLSNNGSVEFSGNSASNGGAIDGYTITLSNNGSVEFSGNSASGGYARGGAIYTEGSLYICNNDSAEFAGNVEKEGSAYRLRSVYANSWEKTVELSAAAGKSVTFYDSIYVSASVLLNSNCVDAEGNIIEQKGDIVFTGATTEDDLYKAKGNVAGTEEEIRLSRTTEVNAMTNLYGGRLRIEDGAIYQGRGIKVREGSKATVRVKDAMLSHSGYDLIFNAGTTLELEGANTITGNLDLMSGSSLVFENSGEFGVTIHEGALSIADDVCVDVRVDSTYWAEEYGETWDMVLLTTNATVEDGSVRYKIRPLGETWGYTDVAWTDGTLAISFKKGAERALWQNTSGDYRWNTRSVNWMDGKYHFANVEGASVVLGQTGAGTITLEGSISIAGMSVDTGSSYELVLTEGASLSVSGALNVAENSQLDMGFGLALASVDNRGDLSLADDLTVSGAITGGGSLSVEGAVSAPSLQAGSISVDSLTLTDAEAQNSIGSSVSMAGAATVAGGLSIDGSLSAASLQAGSLSATALTLTDAEALNIIGSSVSMAGAATVAGGLSIEGSLSAASLQAGSLSATALTLTDAEAQNSIGSSVSMAGAATVAGGLSIEGSLSAASLQAGSLSATALTLTDAEAQNSIGSSVSMAGAATVAGGLSIEGALTAASLQAGSLSVDSLTLTSDEALNSICSSVSMAGAVAVAGGLSIEGALTAASLQAGSLSATSLNLTTAEAQNSIGSSVSMAGAVAVAGSLEIAGNLSAPEISVGGELKAASLQTDMLTTQSLTLTDAAAQNSIGSSVSMAGAATVAGGLSIDGSLSAASLQAGSLSATSLNLTTAEAQNSIGSSLSMTGNISVAGSLEIAGNLSAPEISVGGELKAASLQTDMLTTQSLELTDAAAQNSIGSSVSMAGTATVAGGLNIEGSFSAASLQTGSLSADSLTLTDAEAQNNIGSSVSMIGAATVAGGLNIEGSLTAASLQAGSLSVESLALTDAEAQNSIGSSVSMAGAATVAGGLNIEGLLTAASLQAGSLSADSLTLTEAGAANTVAGAVNIDGDVDVVGSLTVAGALNSANVGVGGALTAASLTATALNADSLALTAANAANTVTGDLSASSVSLATGATLEVGGVLTADEIAFSGTAKAITAGSLGADSMNFVLDRAALESLGIGYRQSAAIVSSDTAMGNGFAVTLNGDSAPVVAAAYAYTIGVNGGAVQLAADYAYDGMQVWYRGGWVGDSSWTDYFIAGFDAAEGKETVDLGGAVVTGSNLFIAFEEGVTTSTVQNGSLNFEYIDMGGGQFELGEGAAATTDELYGKGETLVMHEGSTLNVTKLTLGTLALEAGTITVKNATLNTISGTEGTLNIASGGKVTVKSDVTLTGLNNEGTLSMGQKKLTVNALVDVGGNVTAGEVTVQSRGSRMASFDKLVADKVTVANSMNVGRYTDDLSVGDGSVIGELVAETLEVRGGTVTLGRSSGGTEMSLLNLDLQEDATLVLNQQTALAVTETLTATENATVQLKQDASLSYGEVYLTNKKSDSVASVNASGLSGEADLQVQNAHVVAHAADATIDYQLVNSTVENAAGGTLKVTHENNTLNGVYATGGNVEVYNVSAPMSLEELCIATGLSVSLMTCAPETPMMPEHEADVTVVGLAVFEKGATLNANLTLAAGSELRMEGPLHMGSTLELVSGADSITLSGSMLDAVMNLGECESYTLFTGVDSLTLTFDGSSVTYQPGTLNEGHKVLASTYFSNFVGTAQENSLYITFNIAEVGGGELAFYQAPEPSTVTLSLLALAALAARRRRK